MEFQSTRVYFSPFLNFFMVKFSKVSLVEFNCFSPFLNFFMVKSTRMRMMIFYSFSPFLNFFM
ncbi:hypothetical protein FXV18_08245, partial [Campylobacter jejuni]|nr:hypothetical protein [Campylobacter jejuni]